MRYNYIEVYVFIRFLKSGTTEQLQLYDVQVYGCFKSVYFTT